jgi:hypothetical protein
MAWEPQHEHQQDMDEDEMENTDDWTSEAILEKAVANLSGEVK